MGQNEHLLVGQGGTEVFCNVHVQNRAKMMILAIGYQADDEYLKTHHLRMRSAPGSDRANKQTYQRLEDEVVVQIRVRVLHQYAEQ